MILFWCKNVDILHSFYIMHVFNELFKEFFYREATLQCENRVDQELALWLSANGLGTQ